jgi:DNA-binding beta-propeller fold protein YncE
MRTPPIVVALLLLAGCGVRPASPPAPLPAQPLVWPASPAEPRIRYVQSIRGPQDAGIAKAFLIRLAETVLGRAEEFFIRPTGVAERDGVIYVTDPGAQALWIFDVPNQRFAKASRMGQEILASPVAVAVRGDGAAFVADSWSKAVFLVDRAGKLVRKFGPDGLERPVGLAYDDGTGSLYVADSAGHRIVVYNAKGREVFTWGRRGSQDGEFNHPTHLALHRSGTLLVTDALNFRVQAFDRNGRFLWKMGRHGDGSGDVAAPKGIAFDSQEHVYVVDALFDAVQIFERDGTFLLAFGERGVQPGQFWLPGGLFINSRDRIYVADSYNQRVQVFDFLRTPD